MIVYMGRRCAVCRERMYYGFILSAPDEDTKYDVLSGVAIVGRAAGRSAYHPKCMPPDVRATSDAYLADMRFRRNGRRRWKRVAERLIEGAAK